jgi:hypothetical protein
MIKDIHLTWSLAAWFVADFPVALWDGAEAWVLETPIQSANKRGTADIAGLILVIGLRTELDFKGEAEVRVGVIEAQTSSKALSLGFSFVDVASWCWLHKKQATDAEGAMIYTANLSTNFIPIVSARLPFSLIAGWLIFGSAAVQEQEMKEPLICRTILPYCHVFLS